MYLGIEIGGTKLQLGVGTAEDGALMAVEYATVVPDKGDEGIRNQIQQIGAALCARFPIQSIGIGFGGPVDMTSGRIIKSHHVAGWDGFQIVAWCRDVFGLPTCLGNDSDMAGLGEARFGAGKGSRVVFYTNVGSGIGGALCVDGRVFLGGGGVASELGHLRPGPDADDPHKIVETSSSGWAIAKAARADAHLADELQRRHGCARDQLTAKMVAQAAESGNPSARAIFHRAMQVYGWAVAQMITLLSPQTVVIGGGVPLCGEPLFFGPLREEVDRYVFPPLRGTYRIVSAELGEEVVLYGALTLARALAEEGTTKNLFFP
jgi:glucokinase